MFGGSAINKPPYSRCAGTSPKGGRSRGGKSCPFGGSGPKGRWGPCLLSSVFPAKAGTQNLCQCGKGLAICSYSRVTRLRRQGMPPLTQPSPPRGRGLYRSYPFPCGRGLGEGLVFLIRPVRYRARCNSPGPQPRFPFVSRVRGPAETQRRPPKFTFVQFGTVRERTGLMI